MTDGAPDFDDGTELPPLARRGLPWERWEDSILEWSWGVFSFETIAKRLGRTPAGVLGRGKELGLGPLGRGRLNLTELAEETGFGPRALKQAAARANVPLKRRPSMGYRGVNARPRRGRVFGIDSDDAAVIVDELLSAPNTNYIGGTREGEWGTGGKPAACCDCGTTELPHRARGVCGPCYSARRSKGTLHELPPVRRRNDATLLGAEETRYVDRWTGAWGIGGKPAACLDCGETSRPHRARGICNACYIVRRGAGTLAERPLLTTPRGATIGREEEPPP